MDVIGVSLDFLGLESEDGEDGDSIAAVLLDDVRMINYDEVLRLPTLVL